MRIIISAGKVKREIVGPYAIYVSAEDLAILKTALNRVSEYHNYGWIEISEFAPEIINTPPIPWNER